LVSKNLAEIRTIYICYNYFDFKIFAAPLIKIFFAKQKKSCCLQNSYYTSKLKFGLALNTVLSSSMWDAEGTAKHSETEIATV